MPVKQSYKEPLASGAPSLAWSARLRVRASRETIALKLKLVFMCLFVLCVPLIIVSVADLHDWLLFWSFNFRNIGLKPIFQKNYLNCLSTLTQNLIMLKGIFKLLDSLATKTESKLFSGYFLPKKSEIFCTN